ncbi:terminase small subunit [Burkholderia multivorans]|uniref:Terminase small subunit n=1 Tax=Burkholderia multivorans TaxID=87883 RepID=A0AB37ASQ9_9BURK|nr:terminase small subunit [Burkholderia multivorans]MBN6728210.1 terminase small subunit [Burkholderia multivorans]MBN6738083.1 terminase small subunit [Burkholderia multivorans]MBN7128752.1 terminase small subunit [Burkholderia multivorans]MBN8169765.1 terminase small subunit [Burkholderia multivorans]MBU9340442.1 terminase small subunit [Burkholderia multivorans]
MKKLTAKQQRFVDEYLVDLNASAAARRAGYSVKTADRIGAQLLGKTWVATKVAEAIKARSERTHITQDRVLRELSRIAFFDIRKLYNADGTLKRPDQLDDEAAAVLAGVDVVEQMTYTADGDGELTATPTLTKKAKVFDKTAALTLAMRHLGLLNDKLEISKRPRVRVVDQTGRKLRVKGD